jgi:plastocyanin
MDKAHGNLSKLAIVIVALAAIAVTYVLVSQSPTQNAGNPTTTSSNQLQCPSSCPSPTGWGGCANGVRQRTNYRCDQTTGYNCQAYSETQNCAQSPPPTPAANVHDVLILNSAFSPKTLTIQSGDIVRWTNLDSIQHKVTADNGSFTTNALGKGEMGQVTFSTKGTFTYHCSIHPTMTGTVIVQ